MPSRGVDVPRMVDTVRVVENRRGNLVHNPGENSQTLQRLVVRIVIHSVDNVAIRGVRRGVFLARF
jgi:hypothetical protein